MIKPTVGRIVLYWEALPGGFNRPELIEKHMASVQPQAAIVTFVHPDSDRINVTRFSSEGIAIPQTDVPLVQDDAARPSHGGWAEWMPYQKGQAAKTQSLEARLASDEARKIALEDSVAADEARINHAEAAKTDS